MKIRVLLFAGLRERLHREEISLEVSEDTKAAQVLGLVFSDPLEAAKISRSTLFAINQNYARPDAKLSDGDELALIPPIAGG